MENSAFISVNESHIFVFPPADFNGVLTGVTTTFSPLKLPSIGNWWVWGVLASRIETGAGGEMASGSNMGLNIWDSGLGQFWWTGGTLNQDALVPIQLVAGKAGNPGIFSQPKLVKAGSTLSLRMNQTSGGTPTGSSLCYVALLATLADGSQGSIPQVPSMGGALAQTQGEHYKAIVSWPAAPVVLPGQTNQQVIPMNKTTPFMIENISTNLIEIFASPDADKTFADPRIIEPDVVMNCFDTRTTWKFSSPIDCPVVLMAGPNATRPFVMPSFMYMAPDQNFAVSLTVGASASPLTPVPSFVFDGYLQQDILAERVR